MRWVIATIVLLASSAQPATAWDRGPVCREPTVVDEMAREIRTQQYYSEVDPALVTEQPTANPEIVRCLVCVQLAPYNMTRFGEQPIRRCVARDFEVRIVQSGFVVRDLR
jgi:hypothetical protein